MTVTPQSIPVPVLHPTNTPGKWYHVYYLFKLTFYFTGTSSQAVSTKNQKRAASNTKDEGDDEGEGDNEDEDDEDEVPAGKDNCFFFVFTMEHLNYVF